MISVHVELCVYSAYVDASHWLQFTSRRNFMNLITFLINQTTDLVIKTGSTNIGLQILVQLQTKSIHKSINKTYRTETRQFPI